MMILKFNKKFFSINKNFFIFVKMSKKRKRTMVPTNTLKKVKKDFEEKSNKTEENLKKKEVIEIPEDKKEEKKNEEKENKEGNKPSKKEEKEEKEGEKMTKKMKKKKIKKK